MREWAESRQAIMLLAMAGAGAGIGSAHYGAIGAVVGGTLGALILYLVAQGIFAVFRRIWAIHKDGKKRPR